MTFPYSLWRKAKNNPRLKNHLVLSPRVPMAKAWVPNGQFSYFGPRSASSHSTRVVHIYQVLVAGYASWGGPFYVKWCLAAEDGPGTAACAGAVLVTSGGRPGYPAASFRISDLAVRPLTAFALHISIRFWSLDTPVGVVLFT